MSDKTTKKTSRREFVQQIGILGLSVPLSSYTFYNKNTNFESQEKKDRLNKTEGKLGVALVGLGGYATYQLGPALKETEHCYLAGIVTGTPSKIESWVNEYSIPDTHVYTYENFDKIIENPSIDIVYIVLPNSMHSEYSIRASQAGKHVICEKPMALSVSECDQMIAASKKAGKLLSIGYRLHFEPYNQEMMRLGQDHVYGKILSMDAGFGITLDDPNQWRLKKSLAGGGPLQDVGIYCIQGICYTSGMVPKSVIAKEGQKTDLVKFREVEESLSWEFEMENGIVAKGHSSYATGFNYLKAAAENGWFELTSAYGYSGQRGATSDGPMNFIHINQQTKQMDAFALSIKNKKPSIVPGEMGKRDVAIIESIYEAMASGKRVSIHV